MCGHRDVRLKYSIAIALHTLQANIYKILANRIFCAFCDLGDLGNLVHFQTNKLKYYTQIIKNKTEQTKNKQAKAWKAWKARKVKKWWENGNKLKCACRAG